MSDVSAVSVEQEHEHEQLGHSHPHVHVTHNQNWATGRFDHLSFTRAALAHRHAPHQDFEVEHLGEAHEHRHEERPGGKRRR